MEIERKSEHSIVFKELESGEIFIDKDGEFSMKMNMKVRERLNAITLEGGILFPVDDNEVVRLPKSAKLIVEE